MEAPQVVNAPVIPDIPPPLPLQDIPPSPPAASSTSLGMPEDLNKRERKRTQPAQKVSCLHKDRHHYAKGRCSECYRRGAQVDKLTQAWKEEYGRKTVCMDFNAAAKSIIQDWQEGKISDSSFQIAQYLTTSSAGSANNTGTPALLSNSSPASSSASSAFAQLSASFSKSHVLSPTAYKAFHQETHLPTDPTLPDQVPPTDIPPATTTESAQITGTKRNISETTLPNESPEDSATTNKKPTNPPM